MELDGIETSHELWPSEDTFEYQGRTIEQGTIAGFRFEIAGVVGGQTKVAVEHVDAHAAKTRRRTGRVASPATRTAS